MTRSEGYTIIEVSLFLAVSGLLVLIALIGTGATIRSSRFTDSSRSVHAFVQKQYDNILNGVNTRPGDETCNAGVVSTTSGVPAGRSNCLLIGKLIVMAQNADVARAYTIVGTEPINPDYNKADEALIYDFQPAIVRNVGVEQFDIPWGATVMGSKRTSGGNAVDAVAMIRSPRSSRIVTYIYKEPGASYSLASLINPSVPANEANFNKPTNPSNFCFKSADDFNVLSKLTFSGGQGQDAIQLTFDATIGDCDGS